MKVDAFDNVTIVMFGCGGCVIQVIDGVKYYTDISYIEASRVY